MLGYKNFQSSWPGTDLLNTFLFKINSGLLVFCWVNFWPGVCFRVRKFLWLSIIKGSFKIFRRSSLSFVPQSTLPPGFWLLETDSPTRRLCIFNGGLLSNPTSWVTLSTYKQELTRLVLENECLQNSACMHNKALQLNTSKTTGTVFCHYRLRDFMFSFSFKF